MRAGDTKQRRRPQQLTLPTTTSTTSTSTSTAPQVYETPNKRRRKRESTSPIFILTVVLIGSCLVFLVASKLMKAAAKRKSVKINVESDVKNVDSPLKSVPLKENDKPLGKDPFRDESKAELDVAEGGVGDAKVVGVIGGTGDDATQNVDTPAPSPSPQDDEKVLALLYPPGLMGGYRNQVIRILSLVLTALKRKIHNLLLPSLMWTTQVIVEDGTEQWVPIPHDLLFDVQYWNTFAPAIPKLVDESFTQLDCWTHDYAPPPVNATRLTRQVLDRGFLTPIANLSRSLATREYVTNLRKVDVLSNATDACTASKPDVYGGGTGAGRLWRDYINAENRKQSDFHGADATLLNALRPKEEWRALAQSCTSAAKYVALHARMELEMMDHACGRAMQRNLTQLFHHVEDFVETLNDVQSVFVAVSRSGIELSEGHLYERFKTYADENLATLNRVVGMGDDVGQGLSDGSTVVFECGKRLMDQYYAEHPDSIDYGSLLQSMINFYIATESKAFIGVRGSSYSTDIWTTRYHQGKGDTNYEYTKEGILQLPKGGLPPKHTNCGKKK